MLYYFTSRLSINQNNTPQSSIIQIKTSEHYPIPTQYLVLTVYPYTDTSSESVDNLTISTGATTIPNSPAQFVSKYHFDTSLLSISIQLKKLMTLGEQHHSISILMKKLMQLVEQHIEESKWFRNELDNIKSEILCISKDTRDIKTNLPSFCQN